MEDRFRDEHGYSIRRVRNAVWPDGLTLFCPGGGTIDVPSCRYFSYKKLIFPWHPLVKMFHKIFGFDSDVPLTLLASQKGLSSSDANKRLAIFGSNEIAVDLKPIIVLLFREVSPSVLAGSHYRIAAEGVHLWRPGRTAKG